MATLPQVLAALIQEHEIVEPPLDRAMEAAFHLCLDPDGPGADPYVQRAYHFVFEQVLPHLQTEEEKLFPAAREAGFSDDFLFLLEQDHGGLRTLAQRLRHGGLDREASALSGDAAILFSRFVEATRWHMAREEGIFRGVLEQERSAKADTNPPPAPAEAR